MATNVSMLVGGRAHETLSSFERRNPVTGEVASTASAATVDDANAAANAAARCSTRPPMRSRPRRRISSRR
jgi:acyl-CoA reductase-like NAD-dependent aldehyde dehydrogenase